MKSKLTIILLVLLLVACGGTVATPTPTPTSYEVAIVDVLSQYAQAITRLKKSIQRRSDFNTLSQPRRGVVQLAGQWPLKPKMQVQILPPLLRKNCHTLTS